MVFFSKKFTSLQLRNLNTFNKKWKTYDDIEKKFSFGSRKYLDQITDSFLPDVQRVLFSRSSYYVLSISRETAFLPESSADTKLIRSLSSVWTKMLLYNDQTEQKIY